MSYAGASIIQTPYGVSTIPMPPRTWFLRADRWRFSGLWSRLFWFFATV